MELAKDTPTSSNQDAAGQDPNNTGSGESNAPGGKDAPAKSAYEMSHGQEEYPGPSAGGESEKTGAEPNGKS